MARSHHPLASTHSNDKASSNSPLPSSCKATMIKLTAFRKRYEADQKNTIFLSVPKQSTFISSVHLEILSSQSPSSTFYLYNLLSIPLGVPHHNRHPVHRSSLFLSIRKLQLSSSMEKPQDVTRHQLKPSESIRGCNITVKKTCCAGIATVKSRDDTSFDSVVQLANLSPLPFKAGCHSSSGAVRVNEKANDVSGTLWSNQRGHVADPVKSTVSVRTASLCVAPCFCTKMVLTAPEFVVSLLKDCTCGFDSTDKLQILSLKDSLQLFRPDFIIRSQRRVQQFQQRARKRRVFQLGECRLLVQTTNKRENCTKTHTLSDNLFKPKDRVISGKEMQLRSRRIYNKLPEVIKKKEEERRRLVLQTNKLRAEVFKKKLLNQILRRNSD